MTSAGYVTKWENLPLTLSVKQAAEVLGVDKKLVYEMVKRQDFPAIKVGEKRIVIPRDKLREWLEQCG